MRHIFGIKDALETDYILPDFWNISVWDDLTSLGFSVNDNVKMSFEHDEDRQGKSKKINISVYKKGEYWFVSHSINDGQSSCLKFKSDSGMVNHIHSLFEKF